MSYTALYRKFRPDNLSDVKGQEAIVKTLSNQIMTGRIGHAYLFCGTRGTGKTTVAKILAKAVNCEHPTPDGPCGECASCRAIAAGNSMNVIEIDAASNNGVDNVREIRDEVAYAPTDGRYKVYIVDEVHMLSGSAFNALLKTLEEPPSYVIFVLATTEPHKLPATILSRCQRYDFKRISVETIVGRMKELLAAEQVTAEDSALNYIARAADGGMRDALSILDQCIAFYPGQTITYSNVLEVLGAVDSSIFGELFIALTRKDAGASLKILDDIISNGREITQFITDFTWHLRNLLLVSSTSGNGEIPGIPVESLPELKAQAGLSTGNAIVRYIRILSELVNEIRFSAQKRILAEIAIVKLCRPEVEGSIEDLNNRLARMEIELARLERGLQSGTIESEPGDEAAKAHEMEYADPGIQAYYPEEDAAGYVSGYQAMFAEETSGGTASGNSLSNQSGREGANDTSGISRADVDGMIRRIEKLEQALRNGAAVSRAEDNAPLPKPELPAAIPADVEQAVKNFRSIVNDMPDMWKAFMAYANLSLSKSGNLLMVFPNGNTGAEYCKKNKDYLEEFISSKIGVKLHLEFEELPSGRESDELHVNLEKLIKMPIEVEDE